MSTVFPFNRIEAGRLRDRVGSARMFMKRAGWASARLVFILYVVFCLVTVVGGLLLAPLTTWYFFGDWRFWRHWRPALGLYRQGWRIIRMMVRGDSGFMLDVPLTAPPHSAPVPSVTRINPAWEHGTSCGNCSRCCELIQCPILDKTTGFCQGYNAFYWRYFNCGRFPSSQREIDYYGCPKWLMRGTRDPKAHAVSSGSSARRAASPSSE